MDILREFDDWSEAEGIDLTFGAFVRCADGKVIYLRNGHAYTEEVNEVFYKILDFIQEKKREAVHKYNPLLDDNEMFYLQGVIKCLSDMDAFCRNLRLHMQLNMSGGGTLFEKEED